MSQRQSDRMEELLNNGKFAGGAKLTDSPVPNVQWLVCACNSHHIRDKRLQYRDWCRDCNIGTSVETSIETSVETSIETGIEIGIETSVETQPGLQCVTGDCANEWPGRRNNQEER